MSPARDLQARAAAAAAAAAKADRDRFRMSAGLLLVFAAGMIAGILWSGSEQAPPPEDVQIRSGRESFTNPLLDCEIAGYRQGRELKPFKNELAELLREQRHQERATRIGVYFRDLDNGPWVGIGQDQLYSPASLFKVPIIMAVMKQAERDPALLRRGVRFEEIPEKWLAAYRAAENPLVLGRTYSVEELIYRTATESDNFAFLLLGRVVDREVLRRLLHDLGLPEVLADQPDMEAATTPRIYGQLFRVLYNGTYLNHDSSELILAAFARSTFRDGLEAGLPPGTRLAHKFGIYADYGTGPKAAQLHDCGIVYASDRPYFLCVMTEGSDLASLAGVIAEISQFVFEKVEPPSRETFPRAVVGAEVP